MAKLSITKSASMIFDNRLDQLYSLKRSLYRFLKNLTMDFIPMPYFVNYWRGCLPSFCSFINYWHSFLRLVYHGERKILFNVWQKMDTKLWQYLTLAFRSSELERSYLTYTTTQIILLIRVNYIIKTVWLFTILYILQHNKYNSCN